CGFSRYLNSSSLLPSVTPRPRRSTLFPYTTLFRSVEFRHQQPSSQSDSSSSSMTSSAGVNELRNPRRSLVGSTAVASLSSCSNLIITLRPFLRTLTNPGPTQRRESTPCRSSSRDSSQAYSHSSSRITNCTDSGSSSL